ncbi:outer membrane protein assembly factor BamE [Gilvimarinus sp. SDUM040013]|uniref:Outer membrane protein assembly factor BamE n=1 Tax=Gilvimarinus gilvus TaxID=3058038 RepID=A0ABU4S134_9GAMM|nr:outer membrane protein assembly factor BamE [Gilvimarinus sp. SDUM040013]MDO3384718.1 outer membrane protein assembly factor BamE [Gilvimarinus sp. SDUM040013]MDX6850807.1 outer membrane protein assembly factor BamE [Gilvimarinus sp. SDUM040013]
MKIVKLPLVILCSLFLLAGCQYFQFPGVHKINIQQGHIITTEMIEQLEPGMNKRQVRFILGTPLISDVFSDDRWDYYYSLKMGNGRFYKRTLTIYFDGDTFTHFDGENLPEKATEEGEGDEPDTPVPSND